MLTNLTVTVIALIPVVLLLFYILRKDRRAPEPARQLVKGFLFGILSLPLSFCMSAPFGYFGLYVDEPVTVWGSVMTAFWGAAIPEEIAKLIMLWLLLRKNRHFDEKLDGIVYAVCVSLGFAAGENLLYLFYNYDNFLTVGIMRALFAIPAHFSFGVLMGYYYSLVKFYPKSPAKNKVMVILAPILAHGIYDSILFALDVTYPAVALLLLAVFLAFCFLMWHYVTSRIREHMARDIETMEAEQARIRETQQNSSENKTLGISGNDAHMMTDTTAADTTADATADTMSISKEYTPSPADTSGVVLPEGLEALVESLAENVHEVWAKSRMDQGWTYGPERNDALKQHPGLVPYADLPEAEKDYDRNTALGTLKLIVGLGYRIERQ
ncbi:MAG: PrsW family intramembrane metalloprotease [Bacteroidetes bacterium]|uniref:PrsW family intramembrane metalloprotease n=1 Tax=Candidatus Cryptobacteroides gallistercoris TaxID=2840765 RepID=A0A940DL80_9BACT|nr:PrsW family intramembrane metalloprotease [Candidatus Cryptobacteroides gallistercoris]